VAGRSRLRKNGRDTPHNLLVDHSPMLASTDDAPLTDNALVYEPKYDGIRAIADIPVGGRVRLWSRLGNEKTHQFPEVAAALEKWARRRKVPVVLDGEIVALDEEGRPIGFQNLQGRINVKRAPSPSPDRASPLRTAFIAFDILRDDGTDLRSRPLVERRARLEDVFGKTQSTMLRLSEQVHGDGRALYERALANGWEGLIAKRAVSKYTSGKRTSDWRKLKILHEQEFVIGGWTEPRETRAYFGALMVGVYEAGAARGGGAPGGLTYVGHIGTGFNEKELSRVMKLLRPLETKASPFSTRVVTNDTPHWVKPELVVQAKFTEWTSDGKLRQPVYLGMRDDKRPGDVTREKETRFHQTAKGRLKAGAPAIAAASRPRTASSSREKLDTSHIVEQLQTLEHARKDGAIELPDGDRLSVTNLAKIFWPRQKYTKGDLFRYYAMVAPFILPAVADRPLVMKRYPNGIHAKPFYQHRAADVAPGVRVEEVKAAEGRPQIVGGDLKTLLYMTQLASISQDPWFSRVQSPRFADHVAIDLDPAPGVTFAQVLDVARWIRDELAALKATGVPKTSGSEGLHIYIPLPPETPYEAGLIFCQIIATVVSTKHPKLATVERAVNRRGKRIYVDCLQNILGKTLATAYSARSSDYAGVSTPLTWKEVDEGVDREDFTIKTMPERLKKVGDLWATLRTAKPVDLERIAAYAKRSK